MSYCRDLYESKMSVDDAITYDIQVQQGLNFVIGVPTNQTMSLRQAFTVSKNEYKTASPRRRKELKKIMSMLKKRAKAEPLRYKIHKEIYEKLMRHIADVAIRTNFMMTHEDVLSSVNAMSMKFKRLPLMDLNKLNVPNINQYKTLIDKFITVKPKRNFGAWQQYSRDIFRTIATQEETGAGYLVLDKITGLNDNIFDSQSSYIQAYQEINQDYNKKIDSILLLKEEIIDDLALRDTDLTEEVYTTDKDGNFLEKKEVVKYWDDMSVDEKKEIVKRDYSRLKSDLADGRVRYIKPTLWQELTEEEREFVSNYKKDQTNEYGEETGGLNHREIQIKNEDGSESVWLMLKRNEDGAEADKQYEYYPTVLIRKGVKDSDTGEFMWQGSMGIAEGTEAWEGTGMEEGFWEAQKHQQFNYTIKNSSNKVTTYTDFQIMPNQPLEDIAGLNAPSNVSGEYNVWQALSLQRNQNKKFYDYISKEMNTMNQEYEGIFDKVRAKLAKDAVEDVDAVLEDLELTGGMSANFFIMNDGSSIVSYDLFMEAVSENYDPNIYSKGEYWKSLDQAITSTKRDIDTKKDFLSEHDDTIEQFKLGEISGDQTVDDIELSRATEIKSKLDSEIELLKDKLNTLQEMKALSANSPTQENQKQMSNYIKAVHTKHRKTFMNPLNRRRDEAVPRDYINKTITAIEYNKLKLALLKAFMSVESNDIKNFLINQAKIAMKDYSYDAGFFGIEYGFKDVADRMNKRWFRKTPVSPEELARRTADQNNWVSGNLLNTSSALTNYTQMQSIFEDWGLGFWSLARKKLKADEELIDAVDNYSGVNDLINAYSDYMAGGNAESNINWATPFKARFNWALLNLNKSKFINQKTSIDRMLRSLLPEQDKNDYNSLKRQRALFYDKMNYLKKILNKPVNQRREGEIRQAKASNEEIKILKQRIKDLNRSLTSSQVNQLASWMLTWAFDSKELENFTFSGAELNMRRQTSAVGMLIGEHLGLLDMTKGGNKYTQGISLRMARSNTYNTMFGMSREFFPKMFAGYWGPKLFQFKTYTYAQWVREYQTIENFVSGSSGGILNVPSMVIRLAKAAKAKTGRAFKKEMSNFGKELKSGNPDFDISAERMFNFLGTRGLASLITVGATFSPFLQGAKGAISILSSGALGRGRLERGMQSIIISTTLKAMITLAVMTGEDIPDEDEEKLWEEWRYFLFPVFVNAIWGLASGNFKQSLAPYVPFWRTANNAYEIGEGIVD